MVRLAPAVLFAVAALAGGCTVRAGLPSFGAGLSSPTSGYRTASAPSAEYQGSEEPVAHKGGCTQELGQDTGNTTETAALIDFDGVTGCMPENDEHDAYLVKVKRGAYVVTLRALNDIALHVSVFEVGGKRLEFFTVDGNETAERRIEVHRGKQLFLKVDGFHDGDDQFGRYQLTVQPESGVAQREE